MREKKRTEHHDVAELARAQHGVVAARQLRALDYSENAISAEARRGRWLRQHRGVYAVGHTDLSWHGHCMAAVLACAPAVASHWTAAWLWGLLESRPALFHLTAPSRRHRKQDFRVHFAALTDDDIAEVNGIPVTSLARTHLDLAALVSPEGLEAFLERAEKGKHFDLRDFESLLARSAPHHGYGPLRKALRSYRPDPAFVRSKLEKRFRALIRASSIPLPRQNFIVGPYELDCYWPEHRFCVEIDTYGTHGSRRSFHQDRKRQRELRRLGIELERVTDVQLEREPEEVLAAVRESLERRRPARPKAP
jgi:very-short-patch-repair endonuclease